MVRKYLRKTERGQWSEESMSNAVDSILNGQMGYRRAAQSYGVPQTTLERRIKEFRTLDDDIPRQIKKPLGPKTTVFSNEEELQLVAYLKKMEARLFGLTTSDLRRLAYQWAERMGKNHCFKEEKGTAGKDWLSGFLNRHQDLSIRKPENTRAARAMGFNRVAVSQFFSLLTNVLDKFRFGPEKIWNCDETGISVVPKTRSKVISRRGRKQVGALTSAERGTTVTVEVCFNAAGTYMPPMFIYPRKRMNQELMNDCSPGAWAECHPSGWMQTDIFSEWFKKFVDFTGASKESPVLLLLDGHHTHTKRWAHCSYAEEEEEDEDVQHLCSLCQ